MTAASPVTGGRFRVAIAGAGVAGLACAHRLMSLARESGLPLDLTLLEAALRPGGVIRTERIEGCIVEGGPDCFVSDRPWGIDLCRRAGLAGEIVGTNAAHRRSFVCVRGRLLPIPEGYQLLAPGRLLTFAATRILSPGGKARAFCDLFLPRGRPGADESLASFVRRRFGRQTLERLAQPLLAGIYNADPETLSLRATMPRFLDLEQTHRSVILGLLRARRDAPATSRAGVSGARYSLFVTLRSGLQALTDRLAADLPTGALRLGARVVGIETATPSGFRVAIDRGPSIEADALVLAMPAGAAAPLLRALDGPLADRLAAVPYGSAVTVNLAYRRSDVAHPLDGFGFVVPRGEGRRLVACSFSSVKFPGRAPEGIVLLRAFLDGSTDAATDLPERIAEEDLRAVLGITAAPLFARAYVHRSAMAQYELGHLDRVAAIEERLAASPGLALAGNGLRGVGIPDCVRSGELAAERVVSRAAVISLAR